MVLGRADGGGVRGGVGVGGMRACSQTSSQHLDHGHQMPLGWLCCQGQSF